MPAIYLETYIQAPPQIVFDLSRSIDLHKASMNHHKEEVVAGRKEGLINKDETVTWKASHLFQVRKLKVKITDFDSPTFFADEMLEGDFRKMRHEHFFKPSGEETMMIDKFYFESPFGFVGKLFNQLFLTAYMKRLLLERNKEIKRIAETDLWKQYLKND